MLPDPLQCTGQPPTVKDDPVQNVDRPIGIILGKLPRRVNTLDLSPLEFKLRVWAQDNRDANVLHLRARLNRDFHLAGRPRPAEAFTKGLITACAGPSSRELQLSIY